MSTMFVYVTTGDVEEARRIGRAAVEAHLAACANVIAGVDAIYWWRDEVQETEEAILIIKTMAHRLHEVIELIRGLHSYECPCIEAWPVTDGHRPYLDWVAGEVLRT